MPRTSNVRSAEFDVDELPVPVTLTPRQMLEEREDVNVLAPLVRCSKRKQSLWLMDSMCREEADHRMTSSAVPTPRIHV